MYTVLRMATTKKSKLNDILKKTVNILNGFLKNIQVTCERAREEQKSEKLRKQTENNTMADLSPNI